MNNNHMTISDAVRAHIQQHPGQPITAASIIELYGHRMRTPAKGQHRAVLSQLSALTRENQLVRIGDGTYTSPPEKAVTVNIGTPTTIGPVDQPDSHPIDNAHALVHARGLIAQAADILDQTGCTYTYQCTRDAITLGWDRTQP